MNYEEMSDLVIDRKVFVRIYGECIGDKDMDRVWREGKFRPCSNPSDAWPIIQQIWTALMSPPYRGYGTLWDNTVVRYNCGKLRAAMICFLKMKDEENDI